MPIGELPGRIGNFIDTAGQRIKEVAGYTPSGLAPEDELYGINPRRAYWSNALIDLAGVTMGQAPQGLAQNAAAQQQLHVQQRQQDAYDSEVKAMIAEAQLRNAMKPPKGSEKTPLQKEAEGMFPNDPQRQSDWIQEVRRKSGIEINTGDKRQNAHFDSMLKAVPEVHAAAIGAADEIARYNTMEDLIPYLGNTGNTKEFMVNMKSGLNALGMQGVTGFIDTLSEAAGVDFFSGDQGATELFRALTNQDVLDRARELYPVSNTDLQFLKEITATLKTMSDPEAMISMIGNRRARSQRTLDQYNWYRNSLSGVEGLPPMPEIIPYDTDAIRKRVAELEAKTGTPNGQQ